MLTSSYGRKIRPFLFLSLHLNVLKMIKLPYSGIECYVYLLCSMPTVSRNLNQSGRSYQPLVEVNMRYPIPVNLRIYLVWLAEGKS